MRGEQIGAEGLRKIPPLIPDMSRSEQLEAGNIEGFYLHHPTFVHNERATI
jgi:hypothetical protein